MANNRKFSADDASLSVGSIITTRTRKYSDLDSSFLANSNTGDIFISKDAQAVKQSVRNLILTSAFERPFQPGIGSGIGALLFELSDAATLSTIETYIEICIEQYEPRAKVINITADGEIDSHYITVEVEFQVITLNETVTLQVVLERLR